jgi:ADP-ribose pyrophosphatase
MVKKLDTIDSSLIHDNPFWSTRKDRYRLPDGSEGDYFYVDSRGSVIVLPRLDDGRTVMVRQWRYLFGRASVEFPGGGIAEDTTPVQAARRELMEEAGLGFEETDLTLLGSFAPCDGMTNERCHVFEVLRTFPVGPAPEPSEEFEIVAYFPREIDERVLSGEIFDGMSVAAWGMSVLRRPPL